MTCKDCAPLAKRVTELEAEVTRLRVRNVGRPPAGSDERSRLIAAACQATGLTRRELAEQLGVDHSKLSPGRSWSAAAHDRIMAELRRLAGEPEPVDIARDVPFDAGAW